MGNTLGSLQENFLIHFRNFARDLRKPQQYHLIDSECRGVINILIGLGQLLVCPYFKFAKNEKLYQVHIAAGQNALKQSAKDLSPAMVAVAITVAFIAMQKWIMDGKS